MIAEFFENSEIFVTGGSGVVGMALIEKLLRSCNVRRIYVLLRSKKNLSSEQRLEKMCNAKLFRRLRSEKPDELQKVVAIPGDAVLPKLGITAEYAKILENVSIFFHCAATVRFNEPLRVALTVNLGATLEALKFAETLGYLKLFMHVSTFYSNPYLTLVEPKVYPPPMDWRVCLKMIESDVNDDILDAMTRKLIMGFPNTYTFTKNLVESLVNDFRDRLPVIIYRPSIVLHAMREPEQSFPPSLMGVMGLFALGGAGMIKTICTGDDVRLDITPLDFGVKFMLYYAWHGYEEYKQKQQLPSAPVYITSSDSFPVEPFNVTGQRANDFWTKCAFEKCFLPPSIFFTSNRALYMLLVYMQQFLPALLCDLLLRLFGRQPVMMGIQRKAFFSLEVMTPFLFNNYNSEITRFDEFLQSVKGTEFDISEDVEIAIANKGFGYSIPSMISQIREVLFNEDPKTIPKQQKILRIKTFIYNIIRGILGFCLLRWLYRAILLRTIVDYRLTN